MSHPARANQPIPSSFNVMGPNPLVYPPSYNPDSENGELVDRHGEIERNSEIEIQLNVKDEKLLMDVSCLTSSAETSQPSSSTGISKTIRNYQNFQSLLAAVNSETASGNKIIRILKFELSKYFSHVIEEANEDRPQDLSCNKETSSSINYGQDHDYNSDSDGNHLRGDTESLPPLEASVISPSLLAAVGLEQGLPTSRPQIIVSPRKAAVGENGVGNASGLSLPSLNLLTPNVADGSRDYAMQNGISTSSNSTRSPTKSVIVRAGSSLVSVYRCYYY